jgi:hypothetical protein
LDFFQRGINILQNLIISNKRMKKKIEWQNKLNDYGCTDLFLNLISSKHDEIIKQSLKLGKN